MPRPPAETSRPSPPPRDVALPAWVTPERIAQTLAAWQPFYEQPLTEDDAVEMLLGVAQLYRVLADEPEDDDDERDESTWTNQ